MPSEPTRQQEARFGHMAGVFGKVMVKESELRPSEYVVVFRALGNAAYGGELMVTYVPPSGLPCRTQPLGPESRLRSMWEEDERA